MAEQQLKSRASQLGSFLYTALIIISWYAANILVLLSNKYLLSHTKFKRPVFLTLCHMTACVFFGLVASIWMPLKPIKSKLQGLKVAVLAVVFCSTIVLGNASLKYLPVSFTQAIGATTPFFTALLAFLLQGARENWLTYMALLPVIGGVVVSSQGEPLFHAFGFMLCMMATAGRAFKSVVQSMLMTDPSEKLDPMSLLLWMSAVCIVVLVPSAMILEPTSFQEAAALYRADSQFLWNMVINASLAYLTNLLNFLVTKATSALTLQVLGNAKGVVASFVSVMVFQNPVTAQGAVGYSITLAGVMAYSETKRRLPSKPDQLPGSALKRSGLTPGPGTPLDSPSAARRLHHSSDGSLGSSNAHNFSEAHFRNDVQSKV